MLRIGSLPSRLADTVGAVERALTGSERAALVTGCAALGTLRVGITGADPDIAHRLIEDVRNFLGAFDGSIVIESAPTALRAGVDPWGPVEPATLGLMSAIKREFDSRGVLNPGRFVGGL